MFPVPCEGWKSAITLEARCLWIGLLAVSGTHEEKFDAISKLDRSLPYLYGTINYFIDDGQPEG
jgi:hypothetical protein